MKYVISGILLLLCCASWSAAQTAYPLVRYPAISPNGQTVAFSFQGDIWTVPTNGGRAMRLTIHEAYEHSPTFSPDGSMLAFSSDRFGNDDVYVMPVTGGIPERLTFYSSSDKVSGWDGNDKILFTTSRNYRQVERESEIYSIDVNGGTPVRIMDALGFTPRVSPDGKMVAMEMGTCRIAREKYQGPANRDIWVWHRNADDYKQLTRFDGQDFLPRWAGGRLFYLSASSGRYNVYAVAYGQGSNNSPAVQLTDFSDMGIRHFDVSADGGTMVFERGDKIYLKKGEGAPTELPINISADYRFDPIEHKTYRSGIQDYAVSPNGKLTAMVIRGEVFVKEVDKEKSKSVNISEHPYRERDIAWLNDSTLLFCSDRDGNFDLYLARSSDPNKPNIFKSLKHETIKLTTTPEDESGMIMAPSGKQIAFNRGGNQLIVADIDENGNLSNEQVMVEGWAAPGTVSWSPDSKYLAYSMRDLDFNSEIYIQPVDKSRAPVNISMHPRGDYSPTWSPDGSKLAFVSERNNSDNDIWFVWLKKEDWQKTKQDWEEGYYFDEEEEEGEGEDSGEEDEKLVEIDFEEIYFRLEQVTYMPGSESSPVIAKDGETFLFMGQTGTERGRDLFKVKWDGSELEAITRGGQNPYGLTADHQGENFYFLKRGSLSKLKGTSGKPESLPHVAKMTIHYQKELDQVFEDAWKEISKNFYDPQFHGRDWAALKATYKPIAMKASTQTDFQDIFNFMLGELNASHMGLYGSDRAETQREYTGRLGLELMPVDKGVQITRVVPNGPADREKNKLKVGETILSVNGEAIAANTNFFELLVNAPNEQVLFEVADTNGETREVVIRPTGSLSTELYEEWVAERKRLTDQYSNGRLGYIHIRGMNIQSFERFERELTASGLGKDGIVIDVRYNGGGWTTDYLMTILNVRQHAYTIPRGAAADLEKEHKQFKNNYPFGERLPFAAWTKPSVALCNQNSYSNAEIFSHAYKTLDIGTLVGQPTFGAVISTGGYGLMDGSYIRMPFRAWYVKATEQNMEHGPAVPDILVENAPGSKAKGEDQQLKAAVDELLKQIDGVGK